MLTNDLRNGLGKRIIEKEMERLRGYSKISQTGKQVHRGEDVVHFDLKEGIAHYDRDSRSILRRSFKYGPLRLVQSMLLSTFYRAVRDRDDGGQLLLDLPANTGEKMEVLASRGVLKLKEELVDQLKRLYFSFLRLYHTSEYESVIHDEPTVEIQNKEDVAEQLKELNALVAKARGTA